MSAKRQTRENGDKNCQLLLQAYRVFFEQQLHLQPVSPFIRFAHSSPSVSNAFLTDDRSRVPHFAPGHSAPEAAVPDLAIVSSMLLSSRGSISFQRPDSHHLARCYSRLFTSIQGRFSVLTVWHFSLFEIASFSIASRNYAVRDFRGACKVRGHFFKIVALYRYYCILWKILWKINYYVREAVLKILWRLKFFFLYLFR